MSARIEPAQRMRQLRGFGYAGRTPLRDLAFPLYVSAILVSIYGVSLSQAGFAWVRDSPAAHDWYSHWGIPVLIAAVVLVLPIAWVSSRHVGPVAPDLSLIDVILPSDLPREVALRPWWFAGLARRTAVFTLVGVILGGGLAISELEPPLTALALPLLGALLGAGTALVGLWGQARGGEDDDPRMAARTPAQALTRLRRPVLRAQALLTRSVQTALWVGDAAYLRREVRIGRSRARGHGIRPAGALRTTVAADLLMLRRAPGSTTVGLILLLAGMAGLALAIPADTARWVVPALLVLVGLGGTRLTRGLTEHADNAGVSALFGRSHPRQALRHLIVGLVPVAVLWVPLSWALGLPMPQVATTAIALLMVVASTQVGIAYQRQPPTDLMSGTESSAGLLLIWMALPYLLPALVGFAATILADRLQMPLASTLVVLSTAAAIRCVYTVRSAVAPAP
ncbi:hypothetical protein ACMYYO_02585 [Dermacoccaceae bacterium W4C1]